MVRTLFRKKAVELRALCRGSISGSFWNSASVCNVRLQLSAFQFLQIRSERFFIDSAPKWQMYRHDAVPRRTRRPMVCVGVEFNFAAHALTLELRVALNAAAVVSSTI
jgi:hypothetical protein